MNWYDVLSLREKEVAEHVSKGYSNKKIARLLDISEHTVAVHMTVIMKKLILQNRVQVALLVHGLLEE
jgi:two-component system, NarL family, nitrate/nitrite response regulator NarL